MGIKYSDAREHDQIYQGRADTEQPRSKKMLNRETSTGYVPVQDVMTTIHPPIPKTSKEVPEISSNIQLEKPLPRTPEDFDTHCPAVEKFEELKLKKGLYRGILRHGWTEPATIQQTGIRPLLDGYDLTAQAQSGLGKTGAFSIAALQIFDGARPNQCQVLILAPTRELVQQIVGVITSIGWYLNAKCVGLIGGKPIKSNVVALKQGITIAVGCPGRILSLLQKGHLRLEQLKLFVLDDADRFLHKQFPEAIIEISNYLPTSCQRALFSATAPPEALRSSHAIVRRELLKKILISNDALTLEGIRQYYVDVGPEHTAKTETLVDILTNKATEKTMIFANGRQAVSLVQSKLVNQDIDSVAIWGAMKLRDRTAALDQFRSGQSNIIVTTDLLARGIDVQQVSLVINYDLPMEFEPYMHQIGRAGRYGRKGTAINLITTEQFHRIREIEKFYSTQISPLDDTVF